MTLEKLGERVRILEDIENIKKLQIHYVNCLIATKWDDVIDCFTKNGVVDLESGFAKGKKEITKHFKGKVSLNHIGQEGNFVVHPIISIEGDKAKGSWLLYIQNSQPRKLQSKPAMLATDDAPDWMQGYYEMEYVRQGGKWKISYLKWRCRLLSPLTLVKDCKSEIEEC
jgi:hypothetical protein